MGAAVFRSELGPVESGIIFPPVGQEDILTMIQPGDPGGHGDGGQFRLDQRGGWDRR